METLFGILTVFFFVAGVLLTAAVVGLLVSTRQSRTRTEKELIIVGTAMSLFAWSMVFCFGGR